MAGQWGSLGWLLQQLLMLLVALFLVIPLASSAPQQRWEGRATADYYSQPVKSTACGLPPEEDGASGSPGLFQKGRICGACFLLACDESRTKDCRHDSPQVSVTLINLCPSPTCNATQTTFTLTPHTFAKLARNQSIGILPVKYAHTHCMRRGGVLFTIAKGSNDYFLSLLISNVAGPGFIKGARAAVGKGSTSWIPMRWVTGSIWALQGVNVKGKPVSVQLLARGMGMGKGMNMEITAKDVIPASWTVGKKYESKVNFS